LETDLVAVRYNRVARFYDALNVFVEWFVSKHRKEILRQVKGRILEVGVGTGSSFKDYPPGKRILAVDISQEMLRRAREKLKNYSGTVKLSREDVQSLPFEDETFDTVFSSLVFCSVQDPILGLAELRRVLKKGGQLLMLEHVRSQGKRLGNLMDKVNPFVAKYGIDNINRDTVENLRTAGFNVKRERNLVYDVVKTVVAVK